MISWVGFDGDCFQPILSGCDVGAVGNTLEFLGNLRHVPAAMLYSGLDELVWVNQSLALLLRFRDLGYDHTLWIHPVAEHLTYAVLDDWRKETAYTQRFTLEHNPSEIRFRYDSSLDETSLGIAHDSAYWVSSIRTRATGPSDVSATSLGCGGEVTRGDITYSVGIDPIPWVAQIGERAEIEQIGPVAALSASLTNVSSLRVDVDGACLSGAIAYTVDTDGPATISFSDGRTLPLPAAGSYDGVLP
jgi:hypothetical protein